MYESLRDLIGFISTAVAYDPYAQTARLCLFPLSPVFGGELFISGERLTCTQCADHRTKNLHYKENIKMEWLIAHSFTTAVLFCIKSRLFAWDVSLFSAAYYLFALKLSINNDNIM